MNIKKILNNILRSKIVREIYYKLSSSTILKMLMMGMIILFSFSGAIYYIEKNHVIYKDSSGIRIEDKDNSSNIRNFEDSLWWTFVTSTTVGYGDYYPVSTAGRITGILLMFFGVSLVGVITGNIASFLVDKQLKEDRGLKSIKLKNHFIICGWKRDMGRVLKDIIDKNNNFLASEIVLINTANFEDIEILKAEPELSSIQHIHGDYIDESVLKKANLQYAKKFLIVADRLVKGSVQEIDSRTVMTIITVKTISKTVYTTAEILDSKFERYLITANCDEIILSTDYNRSLIATASTGSGIAHVINELLSTNKSSSINTVYPPVKFIGQKYSDLVEYYKDKKNSILIGILENTGNFYRRKMEAIEEAQKTPNISTLIDNLKTVKNLSANRPVINPKSDYIIEKYSKAIIIEGEGN